MHVRTTAILASGLLVVGMLGCSRGPDEAQLARDLEARLDAQFSEGLFAVRTFKRRGSAPFSGIGDAVSGLFVYYDAELSFEREYTLTSWRGLNLGTLAFVLGATEHGISGLAPHGNHPGDILQVSGRLVYHDGPHGRWEAIDEVESSPLEEARARPAERGGPGAMLRNVRALVEREPAPSLSGRDATIVEEFARALGRIDLRFARLDGKIPLGSSQPPGSYHDFGEALARYARSQELPLHNFRSAGSVENGMRLQSGQFSFAIVQSDVAETLYQGWIAENQLPHPDLRAVASLWPEAIQFVTLEGAGIEQLADLRGRRLALGELGSGSRFSAIRVGQIAGLSSDDIADVRELKLRDGVAELEAGSIDALMVTEAVPALALQGLARRRRDVRFVEIDARDVAALTEKHFAYYPLTIPARSYPGQTRAIQTLGMAAVLLTHRNTPDEQVRRVLELLVDGSEVLAREYYRAGFISRETMRLGIAVPLHPAAEAFYAGRAAAEARPTP